MKNDTINGFLFYICIQEPKLKYESTEKEWSVTIAVDKATSSRISKLMPKVNPKMVPNDDFEGSYKTEVPYPDQPLQYMYTIKRSVLKADGTVTSPEYAPRVLLEDKAGKFYDITEKYKVGNGSEGTVEFFIKDTSYGSFPGLSKVIVNKLVEFKSDSSRVVVEELPEDVDIASIANVVREESSDADTPVAKTPSKDKALKEPMVSDDDIPF